MKQRRVFFALVMAVALLAATACGATPTPTPVPPTSTPVPPTATPAPPTAAPAPPTATRVPPTATAVPPTAAPVAPTATTAPTKAVSGDAKSTLIASLQTDLMKRSLRAQVTSETAGTTTPMTIEYVPPDRYHIVTSSAGMNFEMIIIGKQAWQKAGETWQVFPTDFSALISSMSNELSAEALAGITDVQTVGTENLDGAPMTVYSYKSTTTVSGVTTTSNAKLWVGVRDGLPHKAVSESTLNGVATKTTQLITYDPALKIEPPI